MASGHHRECAASKIVVLRVRAERRLGVTADASLTVVLWSAFIDLVEVTTHEVVATRIHVVVVW
ncbi:MAG: hypothetical protein ACRDOK_22115 [Streptosporangiaceae bacterium]